MTYKKSNLEELIDPLRIHLGDTGITPTYSDEFLHRTLRNSVNTLMSRWNSKYYIDNEGVAIRNTDNCYFSFSSPPVIQREDERPIVLQASIFIKSGKKFTESGNAVSWRDEEISYSAIEAGKQRSSSWQDDVNELNTILPVKLARAKMGRLYGYRADWN